MRSGRSVLVFLCICWIAGGVVHADPFIGVAYPGDTMSCVPSEQNQEPMSFSTTYSVSSNGGAEPHHTVVVVEPDGGATVELMSVGSGLTCVELDWPANSSAFVNIPIFVTVPAGFGPMTPEDYGYFRAFFFRHYGFGGTCEGPCSGSPCATAGAQGGVYYDAAPTIEFTSVQATGCPFETVQFAARGQDAGAIPPLGYIRIRFDFESNGQWDTPWITQSGDMPVAAEYQYQDPGLYVVTAEVSSHDHANSFISCGTLTSTVTTEIEVGGCGFDVDGDGVLDGEDNCRFVANPEQSDADGDTVGDACDTCADTAPDTIVDPLGCEANANIRNITDGHYFGTIQEAISYLTTSHGDVIEVGPGTYNEAIDFLGKIITVRSTAGPEMTVLSGAGLDSSVVTFASGETSGAVLEGLTITEGTGPHGGGIHCSGAHPTVRGCVLTNNTAQLGGGMYNLNGNPTITDCIFSANVATNDKGGGIYNESSNPYIGRCWFVSNRTTVANGRGGAIANRTSSPTVVDCVFQANYSVAGGAIANSNGGSFLPHSRPTIVNSIFVGNSASFGACVNNESRSHPLLVNCTLAGNSSGINTPFSEPATLRNCILWNSGQPIRNGSAVTVSHSCIQGGYAGVGNIDADPLFVGGPSGGYYLDEGSPCVDAGDNTVVPAGIEADFDGSLRFVNVPLTPDTGVSGGFGGAAIVDMGAFEVQNVPPITGDVDKDGDVDLADFATVSTCFGGAEVQAPPAGCTTEEFANCDLDGDGDVDLNDFAMFSANFTG